MLPKDPYMLLSVINMKLRDSYGSLVELTRSEGIDEISITEPLKKVGFEYDISTNTFKQK
ncbi:MAG: DUF4250 domain-containing protein [Lachnospiraceae bacterium]|jgi:hypothetical protein|nr:DUF4250 domain-containing protein [Lachnospiraceae bacterium]